MNFKFSYGTVKGSKICACGMQKVRILEVRDRRFVNASIRIFRCTHGTLRGSIQQKHPAPSAGVIVAHTAPCTSVLCSGTLHLGTLQRHPAPSARSIAAPAAPAEFIKIWKWEKVHPLLHVWRRAPRHSAVAPCTLCRIHQCTFYHIYRRTRFFRAAALNNNFLSQKARRSRSRPLKTFANFGEKYFRADGFRQMRFRAYSFGQKFSGKKVSSEIIRVKVFSGEWTRIHPDRP